MVGSVEPFVPDESLSVPLFPDIIRYSARLAFQPTFEYDARFASIITNVFIAPLKQELIFFHSGI